MRHENASGSQLARDRRPKPASVQLAAAALALAGLVALSVAPSAAQADSPIPRTPAPAGAKAYIISPSNGATVKSPVTVRFGLSGMGVAPAGVQNPKTGHHHLIIDAPLPDPAAPIPADDHHRHFGGGQTEVTVDLPPGKHTLQIMLGDHLHVPHDPPIVSQRIEITVE